MILSKFGYNVTAVTGKKDKEEYLAFRYGNNWTEPNQNWITEKDDGSYKLWQDVINSIHLDKEDEKNNILNKFASKIFPQIKIVEKIA